MKVSIGDEVRLHGECLFRIEDFSFSTDGGDWGAWVHLLNLDTQQRSRAPVEMLRCLFGLGELYPPEMEESMKRYRERIKDAELSRM